MAELRIGRVVALSDAPKNATAPVIRSLGPTGSFAALITAAREYKTVVTKGTDDRLIDIATEKLHNAAMAID